MKKNLLIFLLIAIWQQLSFSQNMNKDSLMLLTKESYNDLYIKYNQSKKDSIKAKIYAEAFLLKAKIKNDSTEKISGYRMLANTPNTKKALMYLDSIIDFTKNSTNFRYPARAYLIKANILSHATRYSEEMEELKLANEYANARDNLDQQYEIKYFIALLKGNIGEHKQSKAILKDLITYYKNKHTINERYNRLYNTTLFAYGNVLNSLHQLDSAEIINKKTIRLILKSKDSAMYDRLLLSTAVTHYLKKEYNSSLDSIKKFQDNYTRKTSSLGMIVSANVYLSKIYLELDNKPLAEKYLLKSDSIIFNENYFFPEYRENNELLVKYYKDKKDLEKQLYYINRLLVVDSILNKNTTFIAKHIASDYTTPNLIFEKQKIIESLKKKSDSRKIILIVLIIFLGLITLLLIWNNNKRKLYKKRIEELVTKKKSQSHIINDETTKRILDKLLEIEASQLFLKEDFSLNFLADMLDTNTSYLSKIINEHKKLSFKQYLIDLRIKYLMKQLDENPIIRKYSIEALAQSVGYTNASSFTRIFKSYLGESPSSFFNRTYPERIN